MIIIYYQLFNYIIGYLNTHLQRTMHLHFLSLFLNQRCLLKCTNTLKYTLNKDVEIKKMWFKKKTLSLIQGQKRDQRPRRGPWKCNQNKNNGSDVYVKVHSGKKQIIFSSIDIWQEYPPENRDKSQPCHKNCFKDTNGTEELWEQRRSVQWRQVPPAVFVLH